MGPWTTSRWGRRYTDSNTYSRRRVYTTGVSTTDRRGTWSGFPSRSSKPCSKQTRSSVHPGPTGTTHRQTTGLSHSTPEPRDSTRDPHSPSLHRGHPESPCVPSTTEGTGFIVTLSLSGIPSHPFCPPSPKRPGSEGPVVRHTTTDCVWEARQVSRRCCRTKTRTPSTSSR